MIFDTSIVIDVIKGREKYSEGRISVVTLIEVLRPLGDRGRKEAYDFLKNRYTIIPVNEEIAIETSRLYYYLKTRGQLINDFDLIIAATARVYNDKLVTKDKDFLRLKGLVDVEIIP